MSTPSNRVAIVTGSAQGIGRAIALRLAEDGCDVVISDLASQLKLMDEVKAEVEAKGRKSLAIVADVSKEEDVENLVKKTVKELGGLDIMVANAGIAVFNPILETTVEEWTKVFHTNALGAMLCYKAAAKVMIEQGRGGNIIGGCSLAGRKTGAFCSSYGGSKFAIRALTETAAAEWGPHKIRVNAYAPGVTDTPLLKRMDARLGEILQAGPGIYINSMIPVTAMGRIGQPEEIANVVSFLASKDAVFVTGKYHSFKTKSMPTSSSHSHDQVKSFIAMVESSKIVSSLITCQRSRYGFIREYLHLLSFGLVTLAIKNTIKQ